MVWASSSWKLGYVNALTEKAWEDAQSCTHLYKRVEQIYCGFIITEVSNNGGDGLLRETSLKKSRCFKLYRAYSISSNSPNASNFFFWRWILTDCVKILEKKKKVVVLCVHPQKNVKLGIFTSWSCNDGKEMYKKAWCTCRVVVLLISTNCFFCLSRWCRRSIVIWTSDRSLLLNGTEHHDGKVWIRNRHCNFLK